MLVIDCPHCGHRELVGFRRIRALRPTPAGPIGVVVCARGHEVVHDIRRNITVSVRDLVG